MDVSAHTSTDSLDEARPVSIYDVATAAGVSYQTVSRVINGHRSVKPTTRENVLAAIARLGYRPNRAARALAGGPVQSVTVLTSNTTLYGQRTAIQGIEEAARAADFAMGVRVIESAGAGRGGRCRRACDGAGRRAHRGGLRPGRHAGTVRRPAGRTHGGDSRDAGRRRGRGQALGVDRRPAGGRRGDRVPARPGPPDGSLRCHPLVHGGQPAPRRLAVGARGGAGGGAGAGPGGWHPRSGYQAGQDSPSTRR